MLRALGGMLGLPWGGAVETALLAVVLPLLVVLAPGLLRLRWARAAIVALLCARALLWAVAPPGGPCLRVYASPEDLARGAWERTYATIFAPGCSDVLRAPLRERRDFPIEWMNRHDEARRRRLWPGAEVSGEAAVPAGARLAGRR